MYAVRVTGILFSRKILKMLCCFRYLVCRATKVEEQNNFGKFVNNSLILIILNYTTLKLLCCK